MKLCKECNKYKVETEFYSHKRYKDGKCKSCRKENQKQYKLNNPDFYITQKLKSRDRRRKVDGRLAKIAKRLILISENKNFCNRCNEIKSLQEFRESKFSSNGYESRCNSCMAITSKFSKLKIYYGLSKESFQELIINQNGKCEVCKTDFIEKKICVDHNHLTGNIRGLLCDSCNRGLGLLKDNVQVLQNAIDYLNKDSSFKIPLNGGSPVEDNPVLN